MFPKIILSKREKDAIARMLAISPQMLKQFEKAYRETSSLEIIWHLTSHLFV